jgi:hypothetical protein
MKKLLSRHGATARSLLAVAAVGLLRGACAAQTVYAKPGDTLSFPTPIVNATVDGAPGGDTINSMQLVVVSTDGSGAVTNATPSATQSIAPGASVTFTPSFVVGSVPDGNYSFTLHMVSSDAGIIPDPDSAASDTQVTFTIGEFPFLVGAQFRAVWQSEAFGGLKVRKERRAYRQAGRQVRCAECLTARGGGPVDRFVSYSGGDEGAERSACGCSGASATAEPGDWEASGSKASQALVEVRAEARGETRASFLDDTRFFRTGPLGPRFYRSVTVAARQVMSLAVSEVQRLAKPLYFGRDPKAHNTGVSSLGELALASPSQIRTCRLPLNNECPSRIQTWESGFSGRVPEWTVTITLPVHSGARASTRKTASALCAGCTARSTKAVRRLKKVPAVGETPLAVRRGFLFVGTAGKAGKNVRGDMKGKLATSGAHARSVSFFGAAFLGGHFTPNRTARDEADEIRKARTTKCTPQSTQEQGPGFSWDRYSPKNFHC